MLCFIVSHIKGYAQNYLTGRLWRCNVCNFVRLSWRLRQGVLRNAKPVQPDAEKGRCASHLPGRATSESPSSWPWNAIRIWLELYTYNWQWLNDVLQHKYTKIGKILTTPSRRFWNEKPFWTITFAKDHGKHCTEKLNLVIANTDRGHNCTLSSSVGNCQKLSMGQLISLGLNVN